MRALTLTQPWCGLVGSGIKLVENRPRSMIRREDFGKPFALHASREIDEATYARIFEIAPELRWPLSNTDAGKVEATWYRLSKITSSVIAVATIERVVHLGNNENPLFARQSDMPLDQRRWFFGPVGYVLRDVRALPQPVPCRGWQGFWTLPGDVERAVGAQIARAA